MILRDVVTIEDTGTVVPADVKPLRTSDQVPFGGREQVIVSYYRLTLGPWVALSGQSSLTWHGRRFEVTGDVEQWHENGVLHHQEATIRAL